MCILSNFGEKTQNERGARPAVIICGRKVKGRNWRPKGLTDVETRRLWFAATAEGTLSFHC